MFPVELPVERSSVHDVQSALEDLPCSLKYVSIGQFLHSASPLPSWYLPGGHVEQIPFFSPNLPTSHFSHVAAPGNVVVSPKRHRVHWVALGSLLLLAYSNVHALHFSPPMTSLYVPAPQS